MTSGPMATEVAEIRIVIDRWVDAFRRRDFAGVAAVHAANTMSFDIAPPLRYVVTEAYPTPWEAIFRSFAGPLDFELRDLEISVGGDLAFSRSLSRMMGTTRDGGVRDFWFRWTACFGRVGGRWLIVHDHTSVPTDFDSGAAVLDLMP